MQVLAIIYQQKRSYASCIYWKMAFFQKFRKEMIDLLKRDGPLNICRIQRMLLHHGAVASLFSWLDFMHSLFGLLGVPGVQGGGDVE